MAGSVIVTEKWESVKNLSLNEVNPTVVGADDDGTGNYTEVAHFVSARLTDAIESETAPTTPADGDLWIDTSAQATIGDRVKRYDDATSSWVEINEISGKMMEDDDVENAANSGNFIKVEMICDVPKKTAALGTKWHNK